MLCEQYYKMAPELKIGEFNCENVISLIILITYIKIILVFYLSVPSCLISLYLLAKTPKKPIQVVYVPSHLFHMLFELFKAREIDSHLKREGKLGDTLQ